MHVAVITGSSSGLGREYINAVIKEFPEIDEIWLVARRLDRLNEIVDQYPQKKCKAIGLDLSKDESYDALKNILQENKPNIKLLISNSGVAVHGSFDETELKSQLDMCELNVKGATAVTHICLPYLERGGVILETCSTSAFAPNPRLNVYSATKAYLMNFCIGLRHELKPRGINVCAVHPGWMNTEMNAGMQKTNRTGVSRSLPEVDVKTCVIRT